jgi:hypothetical protein
MPRAHDPDMSESMVVGRRPTRAREAREGGHAEPTSRPPILGGLGGLAANLCLRYFPVTFFHDGRSLTRFHHAAKFVWERSRSFAEVCIAYSV